MKAFVIVSGDVWNNFGVVFGDTLMMIGIVMIKLIQVALVAAVVVPHTYGYTYAFYSKREAGP